MALSLCTDFALLPLGRLPDTAKNSAAAAFYSLKSGDCAGGDMLGWLKLPSQPESLILEIEREADRLSALCDLVIVLGVGGSSLGAQSALDFISSPYYNQLTKNRPRLFFSGDHLDGDALRDLLELSDMSSTGIILISKSGTTTEPSVSFRALESRLSERYGETAKARIICVCGDGALREYSDEKGYSRFCLPQDVGGRYSVLSPVGLLPMAVAGLDIRAALKGAGDAKAIYFDSDDTFTPPVYYAALRQFLASQGRPVEIMAMLSPALGVFGRWLQQLFAESEGKNGGGILPLPAVYTADLHALGQFVQQGNPIMFETMLSIDNPRYESLVSPGGGFDGLCGLVGQPIAGLGQLTAEAVAKAHSEAGVPVLRLSFPRRDAYNYGWLVMFFEMACATAALMGGHNPFDQPGVEEYKAHMRRLFGRLI